MRHIDKGGAPDVLTGNGAVFQTASLRYLANPNDDRIPAPIKKHLDKYAVFEGGDFDHYGSKLFSEFSYYSDPTVKRQLIATHRGKCGFCESFVMDVDVGDVEHYRPKAEVTVRHRDDAGQEVPIAHPGYFWLSQTWDNLYLACKQCNQAFKRNFFDVWPDTPRKLPNALDALERPLLLHPGYAEDELRRLLRFDPTTAEALINPEERWGPLPAELRAGLPVVQRTVEILGLNRPRLVQMRAEHLVKLRGWFILFIENARMPDNDQAFNLPNLEAPPDTAAADAKIALLRAIQTSAEFSALSMDALMLWTAELRPEVREVQAGLHEVNRIRVNTAPLRLMPQLELAERIARANQDSTDAEAVPDTSDLDDRYKDLLKAYKDFTRQLRPRLRDLTDTLEAIRTRREEWRVWKATTELATVEEEDALLQGKRREILFWAGEDEQRAATHEGWGTLLTREARLRDFKATPQYAEWAAQDQRFDQEVDELEDEVTEDRNYAHNLFEDAVDLLEAYRRRGAPRATRVNRCQALHDALENLTDFLDDTEALNDEVRGHIRNNRGYPPEIRN